MSTIFFVSSAGDTDLAKATINEMLAQGAKKLWVVPLTSVAEKRVEGLSSDVTQIKLSDILGTKIMPASINSSHIAKINTFVKENGIKQAYIGVPSPVDEILPYLIASKLDIPCVVANEFMYKDESHPFWHHLFHMNRKTVKFAVPTSLAKEAVERSAPNAIVSEVGHLCIDKAINHQSFDREKIDELKKALKLNADDEYVFVSGTTQPNMVDQTFIEALLKELSTDKYPKLHLRFGIHPGVKHMDGYLTGLLKTCSAYPKLSKQFKIVISPDIESKLDIMQSVQSDFILRANISGPDAASIADKVSQAVPGALLNEAVMLGKPGYSHKPIQAYLPSGFSTSIEDFYHAKVGTKNTLEALGLEETAPKNMAILLGKQKIK